MSHPEDGQVPFAPADWHATPAYSEVAALIRDGGPITFAQFMQVALCGQHGYYTTPRDRRADYLTSPQTHPEFGACVARCLNLLWRKMGSPATFAVAELGAGDGSLMRDVLASVNATDGGANNFADALEYAAYDLNPADAEVSDGIMAIETLDSASNEFQCVISNELLDSFPVHRFVIHGNELLELMVDIDATGMLREIEGEPMDAQVATRLGYPLDAYPDGYVGEIAFGISDWVDNVDRVIERGYALTIDYGHPREALYHPERIGGTLRCYSQHVLGSNPFRFVGSQDITAHVDFSYLQQCFADHGFLSCLPLMSQSDFLGLYGYNAALRSARRDLINARDASEVSALRQRLASLLALGDTRGLGGFLVAIHGRGVPELFPSSC